MGTSSPDCKDADEVADVLSAMAGLMADFRRDDLALQDALSSLAARAHSTQEMNDLQHVDLITQTHGDLAKLLPALADVLRGDPLDMARLKATLTLRSLQDSLLENTDQTQPEFTAGDLSLF